MSSSINVILVDALGVGSGKRLSTNDVIGCGPRVVAGVLEKLGLHVELFPSSIVFSDPTILSRFDLLMVSAMTVDLPAVRRLRVLWDKFNGNGWRMIGGPIASYPRDALLRGGYDLAIIGEAEETLTELFKGFSYDDLSFAYDIRGLAFAGDSGIVINPLRPVMDRLKFNSFFPSVELIQRYPNYRFFRVYVEVVRGCSNFYRTTMRLPDGRRCVDCGLCRVGPLSERVNCPLSIPPGCGYCSVPSLFGPSKSRSQKLLVEEVKRLLEIGCRRIILSGSDFLDYGRDLLVEPEPLTDPRVPLPNIDAIDSLLSALFSVVDEFGEKVSISIENIKSSLVDESVAKVLGKYLKGTTVHVGAETGCGLHARALGRSSTPGEVLSSVKLLRQYGLRPYLYFIHGLPGQTLDTAKKTVSMMSRAEDLGVEKITVYRFSPLPMSAFGDFPRGPPSVSDTASSLIVRKAAEINLRLKLRWLGRVVAAYIVKSYSRKVSFVGYPFMHGPVIFIRNSKLASRFLGKLVKVRVTGIVSDRVVEGVVFGS